MSILHHDQGQRRAWFAALAYNLIPFNVAADWYLCPVCARESAIDFLSFIRTTFHAHHPIRWSSTFRHYPSRPDDSFFQDVPSLWPDWLYFLGDRNRNDD